MALVRLFGRKVARTLSLMRPADIAHPVPEIATHVFRRLRFVWLTTIRTAKSRRSCKASHKTTSECRHWVRRPNEKRRCNRHANAKRDRHERHALLTLDAYSMRSFYIRRSPSRTTLRSV